MNGAQTCSSATKHLCTMSSIKTQLTKIGVEELKCHAQSLNLKPSEHFWDEPEVEPPQHPSISA